MKPGGWHECQNCEGTGRVDASKPDEGDVVWADCGECDGNGYRLCQTVGYQDQPADCFAVLSNLVEVYLCWSAFDALAAEGRIVALIEWRGEPPRVMNDVEAQATDARWQVGSRSNVIGRRDGSCGDVTSPSLTTTIRGAYKIAALLLRAARFAAQEIETEATNTEATP